MARVITLSRTFLQGHPRAGEPTCFVESTEASLRYIFPFNLLYYGGRPLGYKPKHHTIRFGRRWKTGDMASLRVWSGKPYNSKQVAICPDVQVRVVNVVVDYDRGAIYEVVSTESLNGYLGRLCYLSVGCSDLKMIAANDGLSPQDFLDWFGVGKKTGVHEGQILIWGNVSEY